MDQVISSNLSYTSCVQLFGGFGAALPGTRCFLFSAQVKVLLPRYPDLPGLVGATWNTEGEELTLWFRV